MTLAEVESLARKLSLIHILDYVVEKLKEIVAYLRNLSPLYEDFMKKNSR